MICHLHFIIASIGQTEFEIPGGYVPGSIILTVNGLLIQPDDFTAPDGRVVRLVAGLGEGDELGGIVWGNSHTNRTPVARCSCGMSAG